MLNFFNTSANTSAICIHVSAAPSHQKRLISTCRSTCRMNMFFPDTPARRVIRLGAAPLGRACPALKPWWHQCHKNSSPPVGGGLQHAFFLRMAARPQLPGIACSLPSPRQHQMSSSDAVLAVSLTECFFTTHTPCRQSWRGNRIALDNPGVATGLPCQSCRGNRIASPNPAVATGLPRCTTSSSGLELFFPEHRLVMESAPL